MEHDLREILTAGLAAADPDAAVRRYLAVEGDCIRVGAGVFAPARVAVLAVGKAAAAMARAAEDILDGRIAGGLVVTKRGYEAPLRRLKTTIAGHPTPDAGSVAAARDVAALVSALHKDDLLLVLLSGGASALLADVAPGVDLEDLTRLTADLLRSGAPIDRINAVRKHISTLKGGRLAHMARPATVAALVLSDVVGDDVSAIGSGLTVPDPTTLEDVADILRRYDIMVPRSIATYLETAAETPKPGDPLFARVATLLIGSGRLSCEAAASRARALGYAPLILSTLMTGAARDLANVHAAIAREVVRSGHPLAAPCALISGGEATVVVRGEGRGGPNQEFALALALALEGMAGWAALAVDTDGTDGPTDAAGGLVTGSTAGAIRAAGVDPATALAANDAYPALRAGGALLMTGPTGTNVNDLRVMLVR